MFSFLLVNLFYFIRKINFSEYENQQYILLTFCLRFHYYENTVFAFSLWTDICNPLHFL